MKLLPSPQELVKKPTHYRLKELTINYNYPANNKYKIIISVGYLLDDVFNEVSTVEVVNMDAALIQQLLTQAEANGKLEGGKDAATRLQEIADTQTIVDQFCYNCIEDLHALGIVELPRYYTY